MATAVPHHSRSSGMANIIKQGYLKKSVTSNDLLPSAPKQMANNIKQKLAPSRWYVFGVRDRKPYLEVYETEESVFRGQPLNFYDLSTFENLSYTLGKTNTNYTFCIFLSDRTVELTAPNRPQMLDWCRSIEHNMRNLGLRAKHGKEDHQYSAFPVRKPPPNLASENLSTENQSNSNIQENLYADVQPAADKGENSDGRTSPELPPRLPRRVNLNDEEEVFVSLYAVRRPPSDESGPSYFDYDEEDSNTVKDGLILFDEAGNQEKDEVAISVSDRYNSGEDDRPHLDADALLVSTVADDEPIGKTDRRENASNIGGVSIDYVDDESDRCTSLPNLPLPRHQLESSDTSEDSDFIPASFWLRNRKTEDLISFDDDCNDAERAKRKLPPLPDKESDNPPPLPQRWDSKNSQSKSLKHFKVSDEIKGKNNKHGRVSPTLLKLGYAPKPANVPEAVLVDINNGSEHTEIPPVQDTKSSLKSQRSIKLPLRTKRLSKETDTDVKQAVDDGTDNEDDNAYELLACKNEINTEVKHTSDSVYGTTWPSDGNNDCSKASNVDLNEKKEHSKLKANVSQSKVSKHTDRKSKKSKELPEALIVTLPSTNVDQASKFSHNSDSEEDVHVEDANLYSDFPLKTSTNIVAASNSEKIDSEILKLSLENGPSTVPTNVSPVLPRRILKTDTEKVWSPDPPSVTSMPPKKHDLSKSVSENWKPCDMRSNSLSRNGDRNRFSLNEVSYDKPTAPPRRNRKTVSGTNVLYLAESGLHRTVITNSKDLPSPPKERPPPIPQNASPPIPRKRYSLLVHEEKEHNETALKAKLPGKMDEERPALPPPRESILRHPEVDGRTEFVRGARPKSGIHFSNRQQLSHTGAINVMNLKQNQVDILRSEIDSTGGMVRVIPKVHFQSGLALVECFDRIWIAGWDLKKFPRLYDKFHIGDQVTAVNDVQLHELTFAQKLVKNVKADNIEVTVRRLPNAKVFAIQRTAEGESLGLKREGGTAEIVYVDPHGLAARHGLSGKTQNMEESGFCTWTLTEVNMRPLNLFFKDKEIEHRLLAVGRDISIIVQPTDFIKELKKLMKKIKGYKEFVVQ